MLSGLLSVDGKKVLHMDREDYYGGASASLNLTQVCRVSRCAVRGVENEDFKGWERRMHGFWWFDMIQIAGTWQAIT
jgi:RAB protein geranylgeranyltransferase component A